MAKRLYCPIKEKARYEKKYRTSWRYRTQVLLGGMRKRARKKGLPFDLDFEWLYPKIRHGRCECSGVPFDLNSPVFNPSLDQRVPGDGYTKENVQVVVWMFNAAKGSGTNEDVEKFARSLHERLS